MTRKEVADMLDEMRLPVAYYSFETSLNVQYPFIVYYYGSSADKIADDTNYVKIDTLRIELYAQQVDFNLEEALEELLNENGIVYDKDRAYISQEHSWETIYESEVIING